MVIGLCTVELRLSEASNLKEKRRVIKSILARSRSRFNVSAAEIDHQDNWKRAMLGFAAVSNETSPIYRIFASLVHQLEANKQIEILDFSTETY